MRLVFKLAIAAAALTLCVAAMSGAPPVRSESADHPRLSARPCPPGMKTVKCTALLIVTATLR